MANASLLLDSTWDLTTDADNNIAIIVEPNSLAQDAASAIQTYLGEYYWNTLIGVPWLTQVLGVNPPPPLALLKQLLIEAALSASDDIASAQVFLTSFSNRSISGQVQVVSTTGQFSAANFSTANFSVVNLQGGG
jgi:hypothetical protein